MKRKGFKEERVTTIGLYDIGKSTTLESNKSHLAMPRPLVASGTSRGWGRLACDNTQLRYVGNNTN